MKKLRSEELIPGMITAEDIYNYNDQLILPKGLILTEKAISKLQFYAIYQVRIEDEMANADALSKPEESSIGNIPEPEPIPEDIPSMISSEPASVSEKQAITVAPASETFEKNRSFSVPVASYQEKIKSSQDFQQFKQAFEDEVEDFKSKINEVVLKNAPLDVNLLLDDALNVISQGKGSYSIFDMLQSMRENDDTTYTHCLNVGLFCNVFAGWLKLPEEETRIATLCGLLHDIGKLRVPDNLLKKAEPYTEEEKIAIKEHTREGYLLVKNLDIDSHIKNAILTHHERCDGSGYPFGLAGFRIDPFAKMVAIADVYDTRTSHRPHHIAMTPFRAIEMMQKEAMQKYDVRLIMIFLENVMNTFIGHRVLLSTGEKGEVIFINKNNITRPTVKCGNHFIDLDKEKDIQVVMVL